MCKVAHTENSHQLKNKYIFLNLIQFYFIYIIIRRPLLKKQQALCGYIVRPSVSLCHLVPPTKHMVRFFRILWIKVSLVKIGAVKGILM